MFKAVVVLHQQEIATCHESRRSEGPDQPSGTAMAR